MTAVKASKIFGGGQFYGVANVAQATPTTFDALQDLSIAIKTDVKALHGTNKFPEDISAGVMTINGKVTTGTTNARQWAQLMLGVALTSNVDRIARKELGTVNGSFQIKVANAAGFVRDLGVIDPATGLPLVRVAEGAITKPTQYSVNKGKYTFDDTREDDTLAVSYSYELTGSGTGSNMILTNQEMGQPIDFTAVAGFEWRTEQNVWTLNRCVMESGELTTKQGDYAKPPWSFMASVDDNDVLGTLSFAQRR